MFQVFRAVLPRGTAAALSVVAIVIVCAGAWSARPAGAAARHAAGHLAHRKPRRPSGHQRTSTAGILTWKSVTRTPVRPKPVATRPTTPKPTTPVSTTPPGTTPSPSSGHIDDSKTVCVYPSEHISLLEQFDALVGRDVNCVLAYNDASTDWSSWEDPWFLNTYADMSWGAWATAPGTHRQLIITQNLFPASENSADWLDLGASGAFEGYARTLATNLVNAGLGSSIIRLGHEANGTWYPDSIPGTPTGDAEWVQFWRNTVLAMRSVPGAHFRFDWTVNSYTRDIPLSSFYPGDDVVDIIGIDAYDGAVGPGLDRWSTIDTRPMGVQEVEDFAAAHDKPLSISEWGVEPSFNPTDAGGGDDAEYVNGIASVVASTNVAYQSYFFSGEESMQLLQSPLSIAAYRVDFGAFGNAVSPSAQGPQTLPASTAPSLVLTGGPAYGSTVAPGTVVTFAFTTDSLYTPVCSLDGQGWRACTTPGSDNLFNLSAGYHRWSVQVTDAAGRVTLIARAFVVG